MPDAPESEHLSKRLSEVHGALKLAARLTNIEQRIAHLEREQRRLESKLDELWRDHTRLVNRIE